MTRKEAVQKVRAMIPQDFGMSLKELEQKIFKEAKRESYGYDFPHMKSVNGYTIFYTDNDNFMMGEKNGGGKGFFARLQFTGMTTNIKISNTTKGH